MPHSCERFSGLSADYRDQIVDFDAPYKLQDLEANRITEELLKHRLGDYYTSDVARIRYATPPEGARVLGFQEEFPIEAWTRESGKRLLVNLVLKGYFSGAGYMTPPIWLNTHLGIVNRDTETGEHLMFERLGFVQEVKSGNTVFGELYRSGDIPMSEGLAQRTITLLRKARYNIHLSDWLAYLEDKPRD